MKFKEENIFIWYPTEPRSVFVQRLVSTLEDFFTDT